MSIKAEIIRFENHSLFFYIMQRWILSRTFKDDMNTEYGVYSDNGDYTVTEVIDQNGEYEQQAAASEETNEDEDDYDKMHT